MAFPTPAPLDLQGLKTLLEAKIQANQDALNLGWTVFGIALVFWMHAGFSMLEAGSIRLKNVQNILFKNMLNVLLTTITWWFWGYAFAFGKDNTNGYIGGSSKFGYVGLDLDDKIKWTFQWAFAATSVTILSGGMAERANTLGYLITIVIFQLAIYPVITHWVWGDGWLGVRNFHDFAGSAVVHAVGGVAALVGCFFLGRRNGQPRKSDVSNVVLGTFILWMGWYGFNGASGALSDMQEVGNVIMNTTIAASVGGLGVLAAFYFLQGKLLVSELCNGILVGLVAITAPCNVVTDWAALTIGLVAVPFYLLGVWLLSVLDIDDAIGAFPVHGMGGIWGILASGLFSQKNGAFYFASKANIFGVQCYGILAIVAYTAAIVAIVMFGLKKAGILRVSLENERIGMDAVYHKSNKSLFIPDDAE